MRGRFGNFSKFQTTYGRLSTHPTPYRSLPIVNSTPYTLRAVLGPFFFLLLAGAFVPDFQSSPTTPNQFYHNRLAKASEWYYLVHVHKNMKTQQTISVNGSPRISNAYKLNRDGGVKRNGLASCGGLIRNGHGFNKMRSTMSVMQAEL